MEIVKGNKTALIIGSTGLVGRQCLIKLVENPVYAEVISLGRRAMKSIDPKHIHHVVDFNSIQDYAALITCNDIYLCLGTTMAKAGSKEDFYKIDHNYVVNTAHIAHDNGADQCLLISAVNADINSTFFYNQVKGEIERDIIKMAFWSTHIFQPSILLGDRGEQRVLEDVAKTIGRGMAAIFGNSLKKYRPTEAEHLAIAMNKVAQIVDKGLHFYSSDEIYDIAQGHDQQLVKT